MVIAKEHNLEVIETADHVPVLGSGGGVRSGECDGNLARRCCTNSKGFRRS